MIGNGATPNNRLAFKLSKQFKIMPNVTKIHALWRFCNKEMSSPQLIHFRPFTGFQLLPISSKYLLLVIAIAAGQIFFVTSISTTTTNLLIGFQMNRFQSKCVILGYDVNRLELWKNQVDATTAADKHRLT